MAHASVASTTAHRDATKNLAQCAPQPAYGLLAAEPSLERAVPILIVAFLVTLCIGTIVHVIAQRRQALNDSVFVLDAATEVAAKSINALKQTNFNINRPQDLLKATLPAWATTNGRHFLLTNSDGLIIASMPNSDFIGQRLTIGQDRNNTIIGTANEIQSNSLMSLRSLDAPFGQVFATQSRANALEKWRRLVTLTTTLSTAAGCVVLILGFAFYWQTRRARQTNSMYEAACAELTALNAEKDKFAQREKKLMQIIASLRASRERPTDFSRNGTTIDEALNQLKSQFLANMSHELRTPLNAIIGFSEIMRLEMFGPLGDHKYREYCQDIHHSGQCLLQIVTNILVASEHEVVDRPLSDPNQQAA